MFHSVEIMNTYVRTYVRIYSHLTLFWQKFRESNIFTNKWFDDFFIVHFCNFHPQTALWKLQKFTLTEKEFRQINYLVISLVKLYFHEIFAKRVRVRNFHTSVMYCVHCDSTTISWK